ncbi:MAG: hypothetical protein Q9208_001570 [Pyrenodesmia sp. 3 TL-2023]
MFLVDLAGIVLSRCIGAFGGISGANYLLDRQIARELVAKAKDEDAVRKVQFEKDTREQIGELQKEVRKINAPNESTPLDGRWGKQATRRRSSGVEPDINSKDDVESSTGLSKDPEQIEIFKEVLGRWFRGLQPHHQEALRETLRDRLRGSGGMQGLKVGNRFSAEGYDDDDDDDDDDD